MKHVFIINPIAGKKDSTNAISKKLKHFKDKIDYEIYVTKAKGDATQYIRQWCTSHPDERVRFYACGGDGTINEVVSGIAGFPNVEMSCYPSGSGNDFIKYYGKKEDFFNLEAIIDGVPNNIDLMRVGEHYSLNVCNFGLDAMVAKTIIEVKRKPIIGGPKMSYLVGIIKALFKARRNFIRVKVDGEYINEDRLLLCTISNGRYVGGGFMCGPRSLNDDGVMDISLFDTVSLFKLIFLIKSYAKGTYLDDERFKKYLAYRTGKVVEVSSDSEFDITVDGEILTGKYFRVEIMNKAICFISPKVRYEKKKKKKR